MRASTAVVSGALALGTLFALRTPAWMNPDEPAHYNAIAELATTGRLPVLEGADYDHAALARSVDAGFPSGPSERHLHYEDHQPPLYYALLVPLFRASAGSLAALRLAGVLVGVVAPLCALALAHRLLPGRPRVALAAAAFVAFLPQALAVNASVGNDGLANALAALGLLLAVRERQQPGGPMRLLALGLVAGLALVTKATTLPLLVVASAAVATPREARARRLLWLLAPALTPALVLALRNASVYGAFDPFALARHAAVVDGEPTAAVWIAAHGLPGLVGHDALEAFRSFWGQLGWMSRVADFRVYLAAGLVSALAGLGFVIDRRASPAAPGAGLLGLHVALVAGAFVLYNLRFVQPQGRYLLPALVPLGIGLARGLDRLATAAAARTAAATLAASAAVVLAWGLLRGDVAGWCLLFSIGGAVAFALASRGPESVRVGLAFLPVVVLPAVSVFVLLRAFSG